MKKIFLSFSVVGLLVSISISVIGQIASNSLRPERYTVSKNDNPENLLHVTGRVNPVVVRNFIKTFKDVSGERWIETKNEFVAMFNYNDMDHQVFYSKKGNWL